MITTRILSEFIRGEEYYPEDILIDSNPYIAFSKINSFKMKTFIEIIPKFRHVTEKIRILDQYPLPFDERVKRIKAEVKMLGKEERWDLIMESFGMWEDYPEDWLERVREGASFYQESTESLSITYAISR